MDTDFTVAGGGTLYILRPNTDQAKAWVEEHIESDAQKWGGGVCVEHRYIGDIVNGIQAEGMTVQ
jgi:hypothetical protein